MFDRTPQRPLPPPPRLDPPQPQYSRTSTINAPGGGDIQEVCRLGLQTLTLFEVQLFIPLPCLRQQSLFNVPDSFRSHSGLNNFQTNITKWASLNRVTKIHVLKRDRIEIQGRIIHFFYFIPLSLGIKYGFW